MSKEEIIKRLGVWARHVTAIHEQYGAAKEALGIDCESPFMIAVFRLSEQYTVAVADAVGDECGWLMYYCYECGMGKRPMIVVTSDSKEIKLSSIKKLAEVIAS